MAKDAGHEQPLFIGIDQENGLVTRISPPVASQQPGPMALGASGSLESAYEVAKATGEMLQFFGVNMNYAPVGDINSEPLNPVIGVRSPGDDPQKVAEFASACARGMRETRVAPCIKHFPGHGDTAVDSHIGLPVIPKTRGEMDKVELVPFRHAASEGIEMMMTAHISMPKLTNSDKPATLSPEVMSLLRNELGFQGVIMTDCLEMDGIRATYGTVEGAVMAFQAGVDNVMICHTYDVQTAAVDRICDAIQKNEITSNRIDESLERLATLKSKFTNWDDALKRRSHEELADINARGFAVAKKVYADAATVVRAASDLLPLSKTAKTIFLSPGRNIPVGGGAVTGDTEQPTRVPWISNDFVERIKAYSPDLENIQFTEEPLTSEQWQAIENADIVIFATRNAKEAVYQRDLGMQLAQRRSGKPVVAIATCNPYDFLEDKEIENYVAVYEPTVEAFSAAIDILYGKETARGKLPVAGGI